MLFGFGRLAFVLWLCAVGGQVFTLFAFHNAVAEAHTSEISARLSALANRVAAAAAERATIGIPLAHQSDLQRRIELATGVGSGVALYVVDARGTILFSTAREMVGATVPASWIGAVGTAPAEPWSHEGRDGMVIGVPVLDALGAVGGAILGHSAQEDARVEVLTALRETATVTLVFLILVAVLAALGTRLLVGETHRSVLKLKAFYAAQCHRLMGIEPGNADTRPAGQALGAVLHGLLQAEEEAARIDDAPPRGTSGA
ncbi:hypothetical protein [Azospirillum sp. B510]|uniref:hypothetical protein n=1 Tax=Azospirillum sp. (strain B510) TaxID=137722 RepID=UPI0002E78A74|nr:hypothetical protein [Azospirillum sp. B510]